MGNTHHYRNTVLNFKAGGNKSLGIATHDERVYVLSGEKEPDFVGLSRGGYGNPWDITTSSGKPLAEDVTAAIEQSLKKKGFAPVPVIVAAGDKQDTVLKKLTETKADRLLLIQMAEWKSDTYVSTGLFYDVIATVYDAQGKALAEKSIKGYDKLGGSFWDPPSHAKKAVPDAFARKFEELLNSTEIQDALK